MQIQHRIDELSLPNPFEIAARPERRTIHFSGRVQGVGFRYTARSVALQYDVHGYIRNLADGRVEVVAEGPEPAVQSLLAVLRGPGAPGRVDFVAERWDAPRDLPAGFVER